MKKSQWTTGLLAAALLSAIMPAPAAMAEVVIDIPTRLLPGVVQSHYLNYEKLERTQPWLYRPVTEDDIHGPETDEPVVNFLNTEVGGVIVIPPSQEAIHIRH